MPGQRGSAPAAGPGLGCGIGAGSGPGNSRAVAALCRQRDRQGRAEPPPAWGWGPRGAGEHRGARGWKDAPGMSLGRMGRRDRPAWGTAAQKLSPKPSGTSELKKGEGSLFLGSS